MLNCLDKMGIDQVITTFVADGYRKIQLMFPY